MGIIELSDNWEGTNMTKKQFIWLGIRVIGLYWLIKLIFVMIMAVWVTVFLVLSKMNPSPRTSYILNLVLYSFYIPTPLFLSVYFLFFGKQIYKLINKFTCTRPDDILQTKDYSEIIVRFLGLWCIGVVVNRLLSVFSANLSSALMMYFTRPQSLQKGVFATAFQGYLDIRAISSIAVCFIFFIFFIWYFLKKGKLFINLLNRLWFGKQESQPPAQAQP